MANFNSYVKLPEGTILVIKHGWEIQYEWGFDGKFCGGFPSIISSDGSLQAW